MDQHAIIIADADSIIILWSNGADRLIGHAAADAVGQKLDFIVPRDYRAQHWHEFGKVMNGGPFGAAGQFFDLPVACRDGAMRTLRGQLHVLRTRRATPSARWRSSPLPFEASKDCP